MIDKESFNDEKPLAAVADVLEYLKAGGWRITRTTLYRHQREGKLSMHGGVYQLRDVDRYARAWLKQAMTGKRIQQRMDDIQQRILEKDEKLKELKIEREEFALARDRGEYIPRDQMESEQAGRAGVLDAGLRHLIRSRAAEWIRIVEGDMKKVADLINQVGRDLDEHMNHYAAPISFRVIIEAEEEAADEAPETETSEERE